MPAGGAWSDPRRLAFHIGTVVAVLLCVLLARWQWDRANRAEADAVPQGPVIALADLDPASSFSGMQVQITGRFDAAHEVLVEPRTRAGQEGAWVLTPLRPEPTGQLSPTTGQLPDEAAVAVVRGWVPSGQRPAPAPEGVVRATGVLVADARRPGVTVAPGDLPTLANVDSGALGDYAGYPVRSGWYALVDLQPPDAGAPQPLQVAELPGADVGLNWQNAAYAVQWVVFAAFAVLFWNRFRREHVDIPAEQENTR
jgi:cytochrome oxidase assembly protein ShyY1